MNHILRGCQTYVRAYIDDIDDYSQTWKEHLEQTWKEHLEQTWKEHLEHLGRVFQCLADANLRVKLSKCQFGRHEVHYLGHVIGQGKLRPDENKVIAVKNYHTPVTKKDVRAFLGLVGYYCRFILHFASIAVSLTDLTKRRSLQHYKCK